jgi:hypothetical protein
MRVFSGKKLIATPTLHKGTAFSYNEREFQMRSDVLAASIEILSLLVAEIVGLSALLQAHSWFEFILVYTFAIACGGLGSRLSAMWREHANERRVNGGASEGRL